ncbi:helicase associated domain-containing protein [Streptomyces sp. NBC_01361]|uniref:helicase associated domain-containing protein n=1 Tax=Streptomyces sp. NBC_01361 TaxID=2903838 RepID=UPI002E2EBFCF|nr:helicase associated domain-containing protein [Streptomyces sp. NBC_01361]
MIRVPAATRGLRRGPSGRLEAEWVRQLDALGMVWNVHDLAFGEGLAVAKAWAEVHGHLLAPVSAVGEGGFPVGVWLKNQRAAARQAVQAALAHEQGEPVPPGGRGLAESRQDALDAIDPGWCPAWHTAWQRCYRLAKNHIDTGSELPREPGVLVGQSENLGAWVRAQRLGWDRLGPARPWLLAAGCWKACSGSKRSGKTSGRYAAHRTTSGCST